jgi:hypothetical protein
VTEALLPEAWQVRVIGARDLGAAARSSAL